MPFRGVIITRDVAPVSDVSVYGDDAVHHSRMLRIPSRPPNDARREAAFWRFHDDVPADV